MATPKTDFGVTLGDEPGKALLGIAAAEIDEARLDFLSPCCADFEKGPDETWILAANFLQFLHIEGAK